MDLLFQNVCVKLEHHHHCFFAFLKSLLVFAAYSENNGNSYNSDAGPLKQRPEQVVAHQRQEDHGNNGKGLCNMSQPQEGLRNRCRNQKISFCCKAPSTGSLLGHNSKRFSMVSITRKYVRIKSYVLQWPQLKSPYSERKYLQYVPNAYSG